MMNTRKVKNQKIRENQSTLWKSRRNLVDSSLMMNLILSLSKGNHLQMKEAVFILGSGRKEQISGGVKDEWLGLMDQFMRDTGLMIRQMEEEGLYIKTAMSMKECG